MRAELAELHRALGATFIYVTHDQAEALTMSNRIAVMMGGNILQVATPEDIYDEPCDLRVAEFIGNICGSAPAIATKGWTPGLSIRKTWERMSSFMPLSAAGSPMSSTA